MPSLRMLCYWGNDPDIIPFDHSIVAVVGSNEFGTIVLLGPDEIEVTLGDEADLIEIEFDWRYES